jgi:4-hydroxybenzoate polyprenyltransferase
MPQHKIRTPVLCVIALVALWTIFFVIDRTTEDEGTSLTLFVARTGLAIMAGISIIILCDRTYDYITRNIPPE